MEYLSRDGSKSYHLFKGVDTACKMWSSGGMNTGRKGWKLYSKPIAYKQLCTMCENNRAANGKLENLADNLHGRAGVQAPSKQGDAA
jgi:hypothetical protein